MVQSFTRFGAQVGAVGLLQMLLAGSASAVPTEIQAWSDIDQQITVYNDDQAASGTYWFIPKIKFETRAGKTVLRPKTLATGKVDYTVRIIPYFTKDLRALVEQNLNITQDSKLKPVVAKSVAISLPDFNYKFSTGTVTSYQYLDVPRLMHFQLDPEEATLFDQLYHDDLGVTVEFTIAYDGVVTDKSYDIVVNCQDMARELSSSFKPSIGVSGNVTGVKAYVGATVEAAFLNTVSNSNKGVSVISRGDTPGMQEMLRRVLGICFTPVNAAGTYNPYNDNSGSIYDDTGSTFPTRRTSTDPTDDGLNPKGSGTGTSRGDVIDTGMDGAFPTRTRSFAGNSGLLAFANSANSSSEMNAAAQESFLLKSMHDALNLDCDPIIDPNCTGSGAGTGSGTDNSGDMGTGLLPAAQLKVGYVFKKTSLQKNSQAVIKTLSMKDSTSTSTIMGSLSDAAKVVPTVNVQSIPQKTFTVKVKNQATAPLKTGIQITHGQQITINAEYSFKAVSGYASWKSSQYNWDAKWEKTDGDLYYRIGSNEWVPVNRHATIGSDVSGGGELQFYINRAAIFNKIDQKLRTGNIFSGPVFTINGIDPQFVVQVSGRSVQVK